jgi:phosphate starvation-inducible membrane PsiE
MIAPKRRLTNHALHGREEWFKRIFRDQIAEAAGILEVVLSGIVLVALLMSIVPLVELMPGLLTDADSLEIRTFLERALDIVIGIEFIKMLAKHSPGSVLEVLLYAIARHMVVGHESALDNLISVGAIALIFVVRKFFFVPAFGAHLPDGKPAPDLTPNQSGIPAEEFRTRLRQRIHAEALADEEDDEDETEEV